MSSTRPLCEVRHLWTDEPIPNTEFRPRVFQPTPAENAVLSPAYTPGTRRQSFTLTSPFANSTPLPALGLIQPWQGPHVSIWNSQSPITRQLPRQLQSNVFAIDMRTRRSMGLNTPINTPSPFATSVRNNIPTYVQYGSSVFDADSPVFGPPYRPVSTISTTATTTADLEETSSDVGSNLRTFDDPIPFYLTAKPTEEINRILNGRQGYSGPTFRPSRAAVELHATEAQLALFRPAAELKVYTNYKGTVGGGGNQVADLADMENCALWIEGIPRKAGIKDLLSAIANTGKVYSTHMTHATGNHTTNACKLVFFSPEAAQRLLARAMSPKGLVVHGARLRVRLNRHAYRRHMRPNESRVVRVIGPMRLVTEQLMREYIDLLMVATILDVFEIDNPLNVARGMSELEIHFGSLHAQAAAFKSAIEMEPNLMDWIRVWYVDDPCE